MSKRRILLLSVPTIVLASMVVFPAVRLAAAQDTSPAKAPVDDSAKAHPAFRLDFDLSESEDGKKLNNRHYSMNTAPDFSGSSELKIGSKVPIESKPGEIQYIDVGTKILSRVSERGSGLQLQVTADLSNMANPEEERKSGMPVVRQLRFDASTVLVPGKPTVLGIVDDPNSKRQFQLEVTVTKLH